MTLLRFKHQRSFNCVSARRKGSWKDEDVVSRLHRNNTRSSVQGSQQSISFCSSSEADDVVEVQTPTLFQLVFHLKGPLTHPLRLTCVKYSLFVDFFKWILSVLGGKDYGKMKTWLPDYTETIPGLQYKDLRVGSGPAVKVGELVMFCNAHIYMYEHPKVEGHYTCSSHNATIYDLVDLTRGKYLKYHVPTEFKGIGGNLKVVSFSSKKLTDLGFQFKYGDMQKRAIETCREKELIPLFSEKEKHACQWRELEEETKGLSILISIYFWKELYGVKVAMGHLQDESMQL